MAWLKSYASSQIAGNSLCSELQWRTFLNKQYEAALIEYANINKLLVGLPTKRFFFGTLQDCDMCKALRFVSRARCLSITNQSYFKSCAEMLTRFADVPLNVKQLRALLGNKRANAAYVFKLTDT